VFPLADGVEVLDVGARRFAWNGRTGRHVAWPDDDVVSPALLHRLAGEGMVRGVSFDLASLVPCRGWLAMWIGDVLWHADPLSTGAGGRGWRALPLAGWEAALWAHVNDARTVAEIASALDRPIDEVLAAFSRLTAFGVQAVQLRAGRPRPGDEGLRRQLVAPPTPAAREAGMYDERGATALADWHRDIPSARRHFDDVETTVAHALELPHPGLGGRAYGEALGRLFYRRGWLSGRVVEVGPGSGAVAEGVLRAAPGLDYTRVELAPALLAAQDARLPGTRGLLGSATALPLPEASVDFLFANEVIADLESVPGREGWINTGAQAFLAEIRRVLRPGGHYWLSEFGTVDGEAEEAAALGHPEVSIQFGDLAAHAASLGLGARVEPLAEAIGLDLAAPQLWRGSYEGLRAYLRATGRDIEARAWHPGNLELPFPVDGLHWTHLADRGPGPLVTHFYAMGSA